MADLNPLQAGQQVGGRFTLMRLLGRGGMGQVWLAEDTTLGEWVALKFLPPEVATDPAALNDLRRETARSHRLTHPNIVRIHDFHQDAGGLAFISMEYVDGPTLSGWRLQEPRQAAVWERVKPLVQQLCAALDYAHEEGVIHRDLKPGNIMLDSKGRVKLADFGIAAVVSESASRVSARPTSGTLAYMSPQQLAGKRPTVTDDIYALGGTLYELLSSQLPFFSGDITHQVLHEAPEPLGERMAALGVENEVPGDVSALIMACLAKDPGQRPQSARAVAEWIGLEIERKATVGGGLTQAVPPKDEATERHQVPHSRITPAALAARLAMVILFLVLLLAGAIVWRLEKRHSSADDLKRDLVLHYSFDQPPQGGVVRDKSSARNDGDAVGGQWVPEGRHGGAYRFGITNSYIRVPNNPSLNAPRFTVAAWIKTGYADALWRRIVDRNWPQGFALSIQGDFENMQPPSRVRGHVGLQILNGWYQNNRPIADGQWHQVAFTYDGEIQRLFVDGQLQELTERQLQRLTERRLGATPNFNFDLFIGGNPNTGTPRTPHGSLNGLIDEVLVFNRALSQSEVLGLYKSAAVSASATPPIAADNSRPGVAANAPSGGDDLSRGLVLYYTFDQQPQAGVARDKSGAGNDGEVVGVQWVPEGRHGGAYQFGTNDSYIRVRNNPSLNPPQMTFAAWVNTRYADGLWRRIVDKNWQHGFAVSIQGDHEKWQPTNRFRGRVSVEVARKWNQSERQITDGQWHQVVFTYDGEVQRLFVDGQIQKMTQPWSGEMPSFNYDLFIGGNPNTDTTQGSLNGLIDEVMMFNRALSPAEVRRLYKSAAEPASDTPSATADASRGNVSTITPSGGEDLKRGLVLYYNFDQPPQSGVVHDESGQGNDGRVVGAHWTEAGRQGGALVFSLTGNYIEIPNCPAWNPKELTLAAWIKTSHPDHFYRRIFEKSYRQGFALSIVGDWERWTPPTKNRGRITFEVGYKAMESDFPVTDGRWHHVAATYDGTTARVYVDGQLQRLTPKWNIPIPQNDLPLRLGGFVDPDLEHDDPKASFDGVMDEVMIYNRALSSAEVWHLYQSVGEPKSAAGP